MWISKYTNANMWSVITQMSTCDHLLKPEGGSRGKKCPILIFQYVIELEKTNKMQKTGG